MVLRQLAVLQVQVQRVKDRLVHLVKVVTLQLDHLHMLHLLGVVDTTEAELDQMRRLVVEVDQGISPRLGLQIPAHLKEPRHLLLQTVQ